MVKGKTGITDFRKVGIPVTFDSGKKIGQPVRRLRAETRGRAPANTGGKAHV